MKEIEVVAAIIIKDNRILCTQRSKHKYSYISEKFEFPGGKIEEGETEQQALIREIQEELSIDIEIHNKFLTVEHVYPDFSIKMHSYICSCNADKIRFLEHINHYWLVKEELMSLDWAAADLPIVKELLNNY
jgi:8-oxo-dGTP diphosphatase